MPSITKVKDLICVIAELVEDLLEEFDLCGDGALSEEEEDTSAGEQKESRLGDAEE